MAIKLSHSDKVRNKLCKEQKKRIRKLYSQVSKDLQSQIAKLDTNTTSGAMKAKYLKDLQKQVHKALEDVGKNLESIIIENMIVASNSVGKDMSSWLSKFIKVDIASKYSRVATDIVRDIALGSIYEGDWTLSKAIWKNIKSNQDDIDMIIAKGVAENKSVVDIAKDLETYVNPSKKVKWNLRAPDGKRVLRTSVDYNAQRLARTLISHAYQRSFVESTRKNPFVIDYIWLSSNSGRVCPLCASRNGEHYTADDIPLDHPNGMCTWVANTRPDSEIIDDLVAWTEGEEGDYPEIDEFARSLGYTF